MSRDLINDARALITEYSAGTYLFEDSSANSIGQILATMGQNRKISLVMSDSEEAWNVKLQEKIKLSFISNGLSIYRGIIRGAVQNAAVEDVLRIATILEECEPDIVTIVGGGSAIDAGKTAVIYSKLKPEFPDINNYEGEGKISAMLAKSGKNIPQILAFQTSISPAHISSSAEIYSARDNRILFLSDPALRPSRALFDPRSTLSLQPQRVKNGALEAFSHCLETYITYQGDYAEYIEYSCLTAMEIVVRYARKAIDSEDLEARAAIALASDIGGIALMTANANCGHLNVGMAREKIEHPALCALLNPYYLILYSNAIGDKLAKIAEMLKSCGLNIDLTSYEDTRALSESVAETIMLFYKDLKQPTNLSEIPGFDEKQIAVLVENAKKELSKSGFKQLPIELNLVNASRYLRLLYEAAHTGDCSIIISP